MEEEAPRDGSLRKILTRYGLTHAEIMARDPHFLQPILPREGIATSVRDGRRAASRGNSPDSDGAE